MIVHRNIVATVSRQLDAQKRVRNNGGARQALAPEGYIILSGTYNSQVKIAKDLGLPIPLPDEYVSARVVQSEDSRGAFIDGKFWRRARPDEITSGPAPTMKSQ